MELNTNLITDWAQTKEITSDFFMVERQQTGKFP
jgi:hypothetical protein